LIAPGAREIPDTPIDEAVRELEAQGVPRMEAMKRVAKERGLSKRDVYKEVT
jgi:DNA-binding phage protein